MGGDRKSHIQAVENMVHFQTMAEGDNPTVSKAIMGLAKELCITGAFGFGCLLASAAIAVCTLPVAFSLVVSGSDKVPVYLVWIIIAIEVSAIAIAIGLSLVGVTLFTKGIGGALINLSLALGHTGQLWRLEEIGLYLQRFADTVAEMTARRASGFAAWLISAFGFTSGKPWMLLAIVVLSLPAGIGIIRDLIISGPGAFVDLRGTAFVHRAWLESVKLIKLALVSFGTAFFGNLLPKDD